MSLFDPDEPLDEPLDLDDPALDLDGLTDEQLLALLDEVPPESDRPRRRIVDVAIPIDQYPPAHTEGTETP